MKKSKRYHSKSYLKQKLMSATAMLVIASILMVTTSYAWYVMSTAPEVSNIKTQVGANGSLEIALLSDETWNALDKLDVTDFDESTEGSTTTANLTWGNLVNLSDSSYGLSNIVLQPARLYIEKSGTSTDGDVSYKVNNSILKVPKYGEDGRIQSLTYDGVNAFTYDKSSKAFTNAGYGVRAIGTSANMNQFQLGMNTARSQLVTYMSAARTHASQAVQDNGNDLANIAADYALSGKDTGYTDENVATIRALAVGLQTALDDLESALKQAFAGYITTSGSNVEASDYAAALAEIDTMTLSQLMTKYSGITNIIPNMANYVSKLNEDVALVDTAIANCDSLTEGNANNYTWAQISSILRPLVDPNAMTLGGQTLDNVKSSVKNADGTINFSAAIALVQNGIVIGVPSNTGILADIADYAGDYTASVVIAEVSYAGQTLTNTPAKIATQTSVNPVYLTVCNNGLKGATTTAAGGSTAMTDYYGYALDLAFRTNASGSNLLLQTDSAQRVYDDSTNTATQGGGSYMSFSTGSNTMSATKMVKLMSAIRVVLMDESQNILGIATLDMTLGKDAYSLISSSTTSGTTESASETATTTTTITGSTTEYAYLDIGSNYQNSDIISKAEYDALPDKSAFTIDKEFHTITGKLYLHEFSMTESTNHSEAEITAHGAFYTGGITIGNKITSGVITSLTESTAQRITALVYMDGSQVSNADVASDSTQSMTGTLNLQFSSSATLTPAENTALRNITASTDAPVTSTTDATETTSPDESGTVTQEPSTEPTTPVTGEEN
jgi:hypothetical protein